ncbi:MAG: T9SS type A sorting domain-containing protein [Bacteroidota bacterium]|nr:MAG: T9SS type A sorting domain-containing protein [Bacteroidota bacterium]
MSGRLVKQLQSQHEAGAQSMTLNLSELSAGLYTVQVFTNDQLAHTSKVTKQD